MRTMCARVVMLAAVLSGAVPIAAQNELNEKVDSNNAEWIGTSKHFHANTELSTQKKETSAFLPSSLYELGAVDPEKFKDAEEQGTHLPSLHSSEFAPLPEPNIRVGVEAMTSAAMDLLEK